MKTYAIETFARAHYIMCGNIVVATFPRIPNPTALEDAKCARLALELAETERITNTAQIQEQTN